MSNRWRGWWTIRSVWDHLIDVGLAFGFGGGVGWVVLGVRLLPGGWNSDVERSRGATAILALDKGIWGSIWRRRSRPRHRGGYQPEHLKGHRVRSATAADQGDERGPGNDRLNGRPRSDLLFGGRATSSSAAPRPCSRDREPTGLDVADGRRDDRAATNDVARLSRSRLRPALRRHHSPRSGRGSPPARGGQR